jgi:RNA polymerase sigma factor (sigma-70 family)
MWRAVMKLPDRQRAMVVLRYYEDLSEAQTAEVLGVSVGTVKSAVSRALGKLREDPELSSVR